jgi:hypothetical protein
MKTTAGVLKYIEDRYSDLLENPERHFSTPEAMEQCLDNLERLYEFITDDE